MCKKYINFAFIYAIVAMVFGVFYREFTKFIGFNGVTNLSIMHAHYFMLGMFFFLVLALLEKSFNFSENKNTGKFFFSITSVSIFPGLDFLFADLPRSSTPNSLPLSMLPSPVFPASVTSFWV